MTPARPDVASPTTIVSTCTEQNLQSALDGGGVVLLACPPGAVITVSSPLEVGTSVVLAGNDVTLDGQLATTVIEVRFGGRLTLLDTTITRGRATSSGGGILVTSGASLVVYDSTFTSNEAALAGAPLGGAIAALPADATVDIYGSYFKNNRASSGGALAVYASANIVGTIFENNQATGTANGEGYGGAIDATGTGNLTLCETTLDNNSAVTGGAIFRVSTSGTSVDRLERVHITNNTGTDTGGAYIQGSSLTLRQVDIAANTGGTAGGLWFLVGTLDGENLSVIGNTTTAGLGGGLRIESATATITFSTIANNQATCLACSRGAIEGAENVTLRATILADNTAGLEPHSCNAPGTDAGDNVQWPSAIDPCTPTIQFTDPSLAPEQDITGPDGIYRVRPLPPTTSLMTIASGCPKVDITGRERPTPCNPGALEPFN